MNLNAWTLVSQSMQTVGAKFNSEVSIQEGLYT